VALTYELEENPASENVYRPDYQDKPIVGPEPISMKYGNNTLEFSECDITAVSLDDMLREIVEIYDDVTFTKGHQQRCTKRRNIVDSDNIIRVHIQFNKVSTDYVPAGFATEYEAYNLTVSNSGRVDIIADYYPGVVRGLDTLSQLITPHETKESFEIKYVPISIIDSPEYSYRGIMIDTAREYFFPDTLKMALDGMMLGRNTHLHWHFAEDDSIPMYSKSYPDLVNYTAFSDKEIYTPKDVNEIVRYAKIRGIKVVPEMEGPAHLHILGFYPEFEGMVGCFRNYTSTSSYHGGPPYAPVNPANEKTYEFLAKYLKDISEAFESDYWHLGGDEVSIGCVSHLHGTNDFLKNHNLNLNQLQDYYIEREREIMRSIRPDVKTGYWFRGNNNKYPKGDILQFWGGSYGLKNSMNGHPDNYFIFSPSDKYYLDCGYQNQYAGGSWCGSIHSWRDIYNINLNSLVDQVNKDKLLGGELPLWSEMNNEYNLPLKMFPRGAALSFKLWNSHASGKEVDIFEKLIKHQYRLKGYGIPCSRVTQRYCEVHTHHCFGR